MENSNKYMEDLKMTKGEWHNNGTEVRHKNRGIIICNIYNHLESNMSLEEKTANAIAVSKVPEMIEVLQLFRSIKRSKSFHWDSESVKEAFNKTNEILNDLK